MMPLKEMNIHRQRADENILQQKIGFLRQSIISKIKNPHIATILGFNGILSKIQINCKLHVQEIFVCTYQKVKQSKSRELSHFINANNRINKIYPFTVSNKSLTLILYSQRQKLQFAYRLNYMKLPLKQITNTLDNQSNSQKQTDFYIQKTQTKKDPILRFPFKHLLSINHDKFDFGLCVPNTVYEKVITLTLKEDLSRPVLFIMEIICQDQKLNNLSQFVFAIKKDKQFEFSDNIHFRLNRKGQYDFIIGVKTPNYNSYHAKSELKIYSEFSDTKNLNQFYSLKLQQKVCIPLIECSKQLLLCKTGLDGKIVAPLRVLKFSQIKSKLKKQVKIPFKLQTDSKLTLTNQFLGGLFERSKLEKNLIEIHPKQMVLMGKCVFIKAFKLGFTQQIQRYLQELDKKGKDKGEPVFYTLRRVLIMGVNSTNIYFHYPIQVNYSLGKKSSENTSGD